MIVRTMGRALAALAALAFTVVFVPSASFAEQLKTPQPVADYFAHGLIPRLIDLYGAGNSVAKGIDFDATTKVGGISRVREWTPEFLAGKPSGDPTRLTNNWIAPVRLRGEVLGLATVWINPADDQPELASFDPAALARQIAQAPQGSSLVHDSNREAWFALTTDALIPLVPGSSGVTEPTTPAAYQRLLSGSVPPLAAPGPSGVTIAALVLGIVIVGLAVFVLLPVKKKNRLTSADDSDDVADDTMDDSADAADLGSPVDNVLSVKRDAPETTAVAETEPDEPPFAKTSAAKTPAAKELATKEPATKAPVTKKPAAKTSASKTKASKTKATKAKADEAPAN